MRHVSYGLFDDAEHARAAVHAIEAGECGERCRAVLEKDSLAGERLDVAESNAGAGFRFGLAMGIGFGALAGAIFMGPVGLISGAALGAVLGGIAGVLGGSAAPDRMLSRLSKQLPGGKVLVIAESPSFTSQDKVDDVMAHNGAEVEHKRFF
jgi:hypothetical protein